MNEIAADASRSARAAADRGGVVVSALADHAALQAGSDLLNQVWQAGVSDPVAAPALLRAYEYSGNYVYGAYRERRLVGVAVGFLGPGNHLHSDLVGVSLEARGEGVGFALKQHQRAWALNQQLFEVRWTFDPLLRRNASFNLHSLGADAVAYLPDLYGKLTDGLNRGDQTDRIAVKWAISSGRAIRASRRQFSDVSPALLADADVMVDRNGRIFGTSGSNARLISVPEDIESLRAHDRDSAIEWRRTIRAALTRSLDEGYRISDFTRDGRYLLLRAQLRELEDGLGTRVFINAYLTPNSSKGFGGPAFSRQGLRRRAR